MSLCIYAYMYICIYVYMYMCIYVYLFICVSVYMYIYIYAYLNMHIYIYVCVYAYVQLCNMFLCKNVLGITGCSVVCPHPLCAMSNPADLPPCQVPEMRNDVMSFLVPAGCCQMPNLFDPKPQTLNYRTLQSTGQNGFHKKVSKFIGGILQHSASVVPVIACILSGWISATVTVEFRIQGPLASEQAAASHP